MKQRNSYFLVYAQTATLSVSSEGGEGAEIARPDNAAEECKGGQTAAAAAARTTGGGLLYSGCLDQPGPVTTWMGDCLLTGKPSRYVCTTSNTDTFDNIFIIC